MFRIRETKNINAMNISIAQPYAFTDLGLRKNNEDFIYPYPESVTSKERLFLVCDGVGGADKGEIASSLACESICTYFDAFLENNSPTEEFVRKSVRYTETCFDSYKDSHPESAGMATTLTLLYVGDNGVTIAHAGDSRIYQIRNGEIIYQTKDHSYVNMLLSMGEITPEEVSVHPKKNVILRAIQGTNSCTEIDVVTLTDVLPGDVFFMCTDGVLENCPSETIASVLSSSNMLNARSKILDMCMGKTKDNYSFYMIPIQEVYETAGLKQNILSFLYSFL